MTKKETVDALRAKMKEAGIDVWVVTCGDFHGSEYYSAYFNTLTFLTGFTGESSIAAVTADKAGLWTDGRYHLQAERELQGSGIDLYKVGLKDVKSLQDFLKEELPDGGVLGFDGPEHAAVLRGGEQVVPDQFTILETDLESVRETHGFQFRIRNRHLFLSGW